MKRLRGNNLFVCLIFLKSILLECEYCTSQVDISLNNNPNAPRTRGSKFAIAFMNNNDRIPLLSRQQLGMFVTTEQESSTFTIQTRFPGVADFGFTETPPGSGLWSRTEVAVRGRFTFTSFPAGGTDPPQTLDGVELPDIAVQDNGQGDESDRLKGVIVEAEDSTHELTVYMLSDEAVSADAFMAINCVEFPTASNYQYYVFSSLSVVERTPLFASRFLITFCEDDTQISVRPALPQTHPDWVNPEFSNTDPQSPNQDEITYFRRFNRFDTVMLSNNVRNADLTGSIVTANRPVSVFVGHQCGAPGGILTCDYLVEQVPPHATYGDLFYLAPFRFRETGEIYRIGSLNSQANVIVTINDCNCLPSSESVPRVALQGAGSVQTAVLERGQYVECRTPEDTQTFCSIQSSHPVTVMAYTLGNQNDNLNTLPFPLDRLTSPIADPAMVYIPPATSYLNSYIATTAKNLTTQFQGLISYILPARIFDNSEEDQNRFRVNGEVRMPTDGYQPINCGNPPEVCAYGANMALGQGEFNFTYDNIDNGAFWGYVYGYDHEESFAYPLAFEMEPTGLAWIRAIDRVVLESDTEVDLGFEIVRGDQSIRTRAFAYTDGGSAIPGEDYTSVGTRPGGGNSNLRWRRTSQSPNNPFTVQINDDDMPEPVEVVQVQVRCEAQEHCYSPRSNYTITIIDDQGECPTLPENHIANLLRIDFTYDLDPPFPRHPFGTVATYICQDGFALIGNEMRTCENGVWSGTEPRCGPTVVGAMLSFAADAFSYVENEGMGFLDFTFTQSFDFDIDFTLTSVPTYSAGTVVVSAPNLPTSLTFPSGQTSYQVPFTIVDDQIGLELDETYDLTIALSQSAIDAGVTVVEGGDMAQLTVEDDDLITVSVAEPNYIVTEDEGFVEISYALNRQALMDVTFDVVNIDSSATGGLVDYDSAGYTLTIPAGQTVVFRNITIVEDGIVEDNEEFTNSISSVSTSGVSIGQGSVVVTIIHSDVGMCEELPAIPNGVISYSFFGVTVSGMMFEDGTVATYSCINGYVLEGAPMRTCVGEFDGVEPQCAPVCDELPQIDNGQISYAPDMVAPFDVGTVATYSCNSGYELTLNPGDEMRTCTDRGAGLGAEFDGDEPRCIPVCPALDDIPNGVISYAADMDAPFSDGTVATYTCNDGYELTGDPTRTCEDAGTGMGSEFDGEEPTCDPVCDPLQDIPNGVISYGPDMDAPSSIGTVATYSCDPGYELTLNPGDEVRTCMGAGTGMGGQFDGEEPTCRPLCPPLSPVDNGMITYAPDTTADYEVGTVATYECEEGFNLVGDAIRVCQSDRTFSGVSPVCTLRPVCADLSPLINGRIEYSEGPPRVLGTIATHTCRPRFFLNGPIMRTCVLRGGIGIFNQTAPVCEPIQCKELPRLANGIITYASDNVPDFDLDTTVAYDCNTGFILDLSVGAQTRTCEDDDGMDAIGVWSGMAPSCVCGCQAEEYMNHTWPDTRIGTSANSSGCPCEDLFGVFAGNVRRLCSGDTINEAVWSTELDFSGCEVNLSEVSQQLCNIALGLSSNNTVQSSKEVVNITSNSQDLSSGQVTVVATVVEHLTDEATVNPEVRENYLETIDNIQQADPDRVFESQEATNSSTRILTSLETFLDNLDLDTVTQNATSNQTTLAFSTFAVQVKEINADDFNGQTFSISLGSVEQAQNTLTDGTIDPDMLMVDESGDSMQNTIEEPTAFLQLPPGLLNECETSNATNMTQRISYSMFLTDTLFSTANRTLTTVGSIVVGARLRCQLANKTMLSMPVNASFRIIEHPQQRVINRSCAVYSIKDCFGAWDSSGCKDVTQSNGRVECVCSQLGHFGILFNLDPKPLPEDLAISLSVITYIGLFLSLCCLMVFVLTVLLSRKLRANTHNLVLLNMSIALIGLYISFLVGGFVQNVPPLCGVVSALLQYFFLVFFSWTAVEAVWLCIKLVVVIGTKSLTSKFLLKAGLPAWFIPVVIVIISAGAGHEYYSSQFYCRPTEWPFYFGFILPFLCIYLLNWTLFIAIMVSLCRHARNSPSSLKDSKTKVTLKSFVAVIILSITLGLGWGFGLVTTSSSVTELNFTFQVIFSVFVGLQGVLIFGLHGVRNKDFRDFWTGLCVKSRAKYPVSSSVNLAQKSDSINKTETLTMKHSESEV